VISRLSDFKTNEYADLFGGQWFEQEEANLMIGFRAPRTSRTFGMHSITTLRFERTRHRPCLSRAETDFIMPLTSRSNMPGSIANSSKPLSHIVKPSKVHGAGVFARRRIRAGAPIVEYRGERIEWLEAVRRADENDAPINHTFFFSLTDGKVIDGGSKGNDARFINHSCEPNCEPLEHEDGSVYIYSLRDIERGEELTYHYALIYEGRHTAALKRAFPCHCGSPNCTGTMLAPKKKKT
jgi:SET domain-containing protein